MHSIFKGIKYYTTHEEGDIYTLVTSEQKEGFKEYINVIGQISPDVFVKTVSIQELDYLYESGYKVKYKNHYFNLNSVINPQTIQEDFYSITLDFLNEAEKKLAEELGFQRPDKFYYEKHIHRSDIEALKVIEIPLGIFASQGVQERILEGQAIDDYLDSIVG